MEYFILVEIGLVSVERISEYMSLETENIHQLPLN